MKRAMPGAYSASPSSSLVTRLRSAVLDLVWDRDITEIALFAEVRPERVQEIRAVLADPYASRAALRAALIDLVGRRTVTDVGRYAGVTLRRAREICNLNYGVPDHRVAAGEE